MKRAIIIRGFLKQDPGTITDELEKHLMQLISVHYNVHPYLFVEN